MRNMTKYFSLVCFHLEPSFILHLHRIFLFRFCKMSCMLEQTQIMDNQIEKNFCKEMARYQLFCVAQQNWNIIRICKIDGKRIVQVE